MKIMVTGANGFIGQEVVLQLLAAGHSVVGLDIKPLAEIKASPDVGYTEALLDLDDRQALAEVLEKERPDVVVALAEALKEPLALAPAHAVGTFQQLLAACQDAGVGRVCLASSLIVYLGLSGPFREEDGLSLQSTHPIGGIKKAQEVIGHFFAEHGGIEVVAMRLAHIYGPRYHTMWNSVSRYMMGSIDRPQDELSPSDLAMYDALSDFCHVADCARGIVLLATAPKLQHRVYNIASGTASTDDRVKAAVALASGTSNAPLPDTENRNYLAIDRMRSEFGYEPQYGLEEGVRHYREWALSSA